jgi:hypothetical protein
VSKHFKLGFVTFVCAAAFALAEPAAAANGIATLSRYASLGELSTTKSHQPTRLLFGMETEPAAGDVSSKWHAVQVEIDREEVVLAHCRAERACPAAARDLLNIVAEVPIAPDVLASA